MSENGVVFDGVAYGARPATKPGACDGCVFDELWRGCRLVPCDAADRADGVDVVFINENEFELEGKKYVAEDAVDGCAGCVFDGDILCADALGCSSGDRADERNVIFKTKA